MTRTVYNDPSLAHAYKLAYRLCNAIGMFPWQEQWLSVERKFYEVMSMKYPNENWPNLIEGIRRAE